MANHKVKDLGLSPVLNYEYPRVARASLTVQWVKNPLAVQEIREMWVRSLDQEDPLEWKMAIHLSILAWEIPWTEEGCSGLVGCSPWGHKESDWAQTHARADARTCAHTHIHTHTLEWLRSDMLETEFLVYVTWKFQVILKRHRSIHLSASESKMLAPRHFGWKSYPWKGIMTLKHKEPKVKQQRRNPAKSEHLCLKGHHQEGEDNPQNGRKTENNPSPGRRTRTGVSPRRTHGHQACEDSQCLTVGRCTSQPPGWLQSQPESMCWEAAEKLGTCVLLAGTWPRQLWHSWM